MDQVKDDCCNPPLRVRVVYSTTRPGKRLFTGNRRFFLLAILGTAVYWTCVAICSWLGKRIMKQKWQEDYLVITVIITGRQKVSSDIFISCILFLPPDLTEYENWGSSSSGIVLPSHNQQSPWVRSSHRKREAFPHQTKSFQLTFHGKITHRPLTRDSFRFHPN